MFQVKPEESEAFYDFSLYPEVDIVITSSSVRSRYFTDPFRFSQQLAFYDSLDSHLQKLIEFSPKTSISPKITLYRNPNHSQPFCSREKLSWPRPLNSELRAARGSKEVYYFLVGINYEFCGHFQKAFSS